MSDLTRVTANLKPRTMTALTRLMDRRGDSQTDVINDAVLAFAALVDLADDGPIVVVSRSGDGQLVRLL